jgi:hypothetical protein
MRQCFALPLLFFVFLVLVFHTAQQKQEKQGKPKRQSKALPHSKERRETSVLHNSATPHRSAIA